MVISLRFMSSSFTHWTLPFSFSPQIFSFVLSFFLFGTLQPTPAQISPIQWESCPQIWLPLCSLSFQYYTCPLVITTHLTGFLSAFRRFCSFAFALVFFGLAVSAICLFSGSGCSPWLSFYYLPFAICLLSLLRHSFDATSDSPCSVAICSPFQAVYGCFPAPIASCLCPLTFIRRRK